eukprot:5594685-Amphidinium_carterae.2
MKQGSCDKRKQRLKLQNGSQRVVSCEKCETGKLETCIQRKHPLYIWLRTTQLWLKAQWSACREQRVYEVQKENKKEQRTENKRQCRPNYSICTLSTTLVGSYCEEDTIRTCGLPRIGLSAVAPTCFHYLLCGETRPNLLQYLKEITIETYQQYRRQHDVIQELVYRSDELPMPRRTKATRDTGQREGSDNNARG